MYKVSSFTHRRGDRNGQDLDSEILPSVLPHRDSNWLPGRANTQRDWAARLVSSPLPPTFFPCKLTNTVIKAKSGLIIFLAIAGNITSNSGEIFAHLNSLL